METAFRWRELVFSVKLEILVLKNFSRQLTTFIEPPTRIFLPQYCESIRALVQCSNLNILNLILLFKI